MIKKKMMDGGKAKPMSGAIGAYSKLKGKDLELEKANYKKFGDGPGSGPSGAMPKPKKKMGGVVKKAEKGGSFDLNKDGKTTFKDVLIGRGVLPKTAKKGASVKKAQMGSTMTAAPIMKKGGSMKKCKYGCK
jgi:hypothetical protein